MGIYKEFIEAVESGETFKIDFVQRSLKVGKEWWVKNGVLKEEKILCASPIPHVQLTGEGLLEGIENLYANYKVSLPNKRSDSKNKKYFKALTMEQLTDEEMIFGEDREVARAKLEGAILITILNGWQWDEKYGSWFWQSQKDSDLIILRSWIEGNV